MNHPADCRQCGVCCFSHMEGYVRVTGDDWQRFGDSAEKLAHFLGNRAFMRMRDGRCIALRVKSGDDGKADFFCSIYEQRPQLCRDLARGSPECAGELAGKAARVREGHGQG